MEKSYNPIIHTDPKETLQQARCVISLLQDFYCADSHVMDMNSETAMGIFLLLDCLSEALEFEIKQVK